MGGPSIPLLLAMAATFGGDFDEAVEILREVRLRCEARGELSQRSLCDYVLSLALFNRGEVAEAAEAARASLEVKWHCATWSAASSPSTSSHGRRRRG